VAKTSQHEHSHRHSHAVRNLGDNKHGRLKLGRTLEKDREEERQRAPVGTNLYKEHNEKQFGDPTQILTGLSLSGTTHMLIPPVLCTFHSSPPP